MGTSFIGHAQEEISSGHCRYTGRFRIGREPGLPRNSGTGE